MTADEIARLRALCDAATLGPWTIGTADDTQVWGVSPHWGAVCQMWPNKSHLHHGNAAFIAAARTALPALLDEVERLRAEIESLKAKLDAWETDYLECGANHWPACEGVKNEQA